VTFLGPPGTGKPTWRSAWPSAPATPGRVLSGTAAQWVARLAEAHHAGTLQGELTRLTR
jgi:hypothetical protein